MSAHTSLGVTVSPEVAIYFLRFLKTLEDRPDTVTQGNDGSVSAVWEDRNHFDPWSSDSDYNSVVQFLRDLGEENYIYESVTEDGEPVIEGAYYFGFARVTRYDVYGEPVDLDAVISESRKKRGLFGRLRR